MRKYLLPALIPIMIISCFATRRAADNHTSLRNQITGIANDLVGSKYRYGGRSTGGFDCSGLTHYVFDQVGISLLGSSSQQTKYGNQIDVEKSRPGDLVFFKRSDRIFHVALVVEKQKDQLWVVHSTSSRGVIIEDVLHSPYWRPKICHARTLLND